ncbi:MAG: type III pantothenate kinase [Omnitrophica WOR_2 bacterium]
MKFSSKKNLSFLVIDQGNTLTKIALFKDNELEWVRSFPEFGKEDADTLQLPFESIGGAIISSVSADPQRITTLFDSLEWIILEHDTSVPVKNNYHTPETLGKDRLAAVVAANLIFPDNDVLVIDAGTAITYDLITAHKEYIGGSISPGLTLRFKALHNFTQKLPLIETKPFYELTGFDTSSSILSGVMSGSIFEIDGFISSYKEKYPNLKTILTGGDAIYFDKKLKSNIFAFPNLVLNGLNLILQHNLEK